MNVHIHCMQSMKWSFLLKQSGLTLDKMRGVKKGNKTVKDGEEKCLLNSALFWDFDSLKVCRFFWEERTKSREEFLRLSISTLRWWETVDLAQLTTDVNTQFLFRVQRNTKCTHTKERSRQRERCCAMSVTPPDRCTAAAAGECNVAQLSKHHWKPRNDAKMTQEFKRPRTISTTTSLLTLLVKQQVSVDTTRSPKKWTTTVRTTLYNGRKGLASYQAHNCCQEEFCKQWINHKSGFLKQHCHLQHRGSFRLSSPSSSCTGANNKKEIWPRSSDRQTQRKA